MKKQRIKVDSMPLQPWAPGTITSEPIITDPFGSYTGLVRDIDDKPVQDADDL